MHNLPFDIESYPNYFLICIGDKAFEIRGKNKTFKRTVLFDTLVKGGIYGFNSRRYDFPMLLGALSGMTCKQLNRMSDAIIKDGVMPWEAVERWALRSPYPLNHFDLIEPSPGVFISLKKYGARLHLPTIADLPYKPGTKLKQAEMDSVRDYCLNDIKLTKGLFKAVRERIELRERMSREYGVDLRSKSDAQIAESVFKVKLDRKPRKGQLPVTVKYEAPSYLYFDSDELYELVDLIEASEFPVNPQNGQIMLPGFSEPVTIGDGQYRMGIGGLHSSEKAQSVVPGEGEMLIDCDVTSYYPSIILQRGLYPEQLGKQFTDIYRTLVEARIAAKLSRDNVTADGLKITINGSFGKLGSKYSFLYSPELLLSVTLTGQLCLLMLIESLQRAGMAVKSANTDGVVSLVGSGRKAEYDAVLASWEATTGFNLETTEYAGLYSRDVNSYLAVKPDGSVKGKGCFAETGLMKDPSGEIVYEAVRRYVTDGSDIIETIRQCTDIKQFVFARNCTGGAEWRGEYLGRTVRWVYVTNGDPITSCKSGNQVALSAGALPVMELPDTVPADLDYDKYIKQAEKLLNDIGVGK